ncbi:MAG TPA: cbb3-type cytochrome c oxidase subunit I [Bacteroidales bacterium]|nr:cbb3-type cytochrome c oxidase subunit I [Bacteroidales bacterium]
MNEENFNSQEKLSPWWKRGVIIILLLEFAVLIWIATGTYTRGVGPPIPASVEDSAGSVIFTGADIEAGQQLFLKKALMNNGSVWGHGAYIGPDFSAEYLHNLAIETRKYLSQRFYNKQWTDLNKTEKAALQKTTYDFLSENRYQKGSEVLIYTPPEIRSYNDQQKYWSEYFSNSEVNRGLSRDIMSNPEEMKKLTAFFSWAAWASTAHIPGKNYSYTNNFPYEPVIGNSPSTTAIIWSALSLIALLAGTALILLFFGRFHYLGWKGDKSQYPPQLLPGSPTASQLHSLKFFVVVILLLLFQGLLGGAMAHYFAEPGKFFGIDLSAILPSNVMRSWHLQTAIMWIATAYMGGGIFVSSVFSRKEPKGQIFLINFLFVALLILAVGSLSGEYLGVKNLLNNLWFWFGNQGWEYLEIGRGWQVLLAIGLLLWAFLLFRVVRPSRQEKEDKELSVLFLLAALAIPFFYLPAFFFGSDTNFTTVETWRFWIIHLWVEGFFELFATVMVAVMFYKLGLVARLTAIRIIYLDAVLFLGAGILGTGHHWYWTGQTTSSMAISATFSALEVVPLILLTLEAADFTRLMKKGENDKWSFPHKWTFYFLIAVGVWNFVGAGIFGFLINLPVVSYYEAGTNLTANHGHAALMGVFGMLGMAFLVFAIRQVQTDEEWSKIEKWVKLSFWGLNIGLAGMVILQLFPSGVMQMIDVINNGYWHARNLEFSGQTKMTNLAWLRLPADLVFIILGILPMLYAVLYTWLKKWNQKKT